MAGTSRSRPKIRCCDLFQLDDPVPGKPTDARLSRLLSLLQATRPKSLSIMGGIWGARLADAAHAVGSLDKGSWGAIIQHARGATGKYSGCEALVVDGRLLVHSGGLHLSTAWWQVVAAVTKAMEWYHPTQEWHFTPPALPAAPAPAPRGRGKERGKAPARDPVADVARQGSSRLPRWTRPAGI